MSTGPLGYGDFQSQSSWDSGQDDFALSGAQTGAQSSGVLNCSNFGYVYIRTATTVASALVTVQWFRDMAGTLLRGQRSFVLDSGVVNPMQWLSPNLGPFFKITLDPGVTGPNWTGTCFVQFTNRIHPLTAFPPNTVALNITPALAAGGNTTQEIQSYVLGPVDLYVSGGSQGVGVQTQFLGGLLTWQNMEAYSVAANVTDVRARKTPVGPYRVTLTNASGTNPNNSSQIVIMATQTGSS